jgi:hypothetical protein
MPLLQIFNSFSSYFDNFCRNPVDPNQPRYASKSTISGSKRQLPEETVLEENRKDPMWNISEEGRDARSQQPAKRQRNESQNSQNLLSIKVAATEKQSRPPKMTSDFACEPSPSFSPKPTSFGCPQSVNARNPTDFMGNQRGLSGSAPRLPASFQDVVYVRKSLLSPEQLQVAAATEQAIRAHETLRSLRSKAMSQTVAGSHTTHAPE